MSAYDRLVAVGVEAVRVSSNVWVGPFSELELNLVTVLIHLLIVRIPSLHRSIS